MAIRRAVPADAVDIATVYVASWKEAYPGLIPQSFLDQLSPQAQVERFERTLTSPPCPRSGTFVLSSPQVVGFTNFGPSRDDDLEKSSVGEVMELYVEPSSWGRGGGAMLLGAAVEALTTVGCNVATLWVLGVNARARLFYEHLGWSRDGAVKIRDWEAFTARDVRYRLELCPDELCPDEPCPG
jgi:GNAT superfamily N-acetyltransferase